MINIVLNIPLTFVLETDSTESMTGELALVDSVISLIEVELELIRILGEIIILSAFCKSSLSS